MPDSKKSLKKRIGFAGNLVPPACVFYIQFLYVFLMTTKESVSVHRMQRFCEGGGWRWGGGGATFLQGALGQKFQPPRNPEREKY